MRTGLEPAPAFVGPSITAAVAAWVLSDTASLLRRPYLSWDVVSSTWHEVLWLGGVLIAAISGLYGALFHGRRASLHAARPRAGVIQLGSAAAGLFGWSLLGLCLGMAPSVWRASSTATWGRLDPRDVLIAILGTAFLASLGLVLGVIMSHWLAAPAAAVLAYLVGALPMSGLLRPAALLQPVQQWPPSTQFHLSNPTTIFTVNALILGTAVALLSCAAILTSERSSRRTATLFAAVWTVLVLTAFVWRPDFYTPRDVPLTCQKSDDVTVCVHPAHQGSLGAITNVATRVTTAAPHLLGDRRILDADTWTHQQRDDDVVVSVIFPESSPRNLYQNQEQALAADLTEQLLLRPCSATEAPQWGDAHALRAEVLRRTGYAELASRLGEQGESEIPLPNLSEKAFEELVANNASAIRQCQGIARD